MKIEIREAQAVPPPSSSLAGYLLSFAVGCAVGIGAMLFQHTPASGPVPPLIPPASGPVPPLLMNEK